MLTILRFVCLILLLRTASAESSAFFDEDFYAGDSRSTQVETIKSAKELRSRSQEILDNQLKIKAATRLELNHKLNKCEPSHDGAALIVAFEGTSSYQPYFPPFMDQVCKQLGPELSQELKNSVHYNTHKLFYSSKPGIDEKWSGLEAGPMNFFCANPGLFPNSYDWYSFPSEETELLDNPKNLNWKVLAKIPHEIKDSIKRYPAGVRNAVSCTKRYLNASKSKKPPKLIVLSHSSGGRAAVKFLEKLKSFKNPRDGKSIQADLVFTLDPVKEAHQALGELASQVLTKPVKDAFNKVPVLPDVEVQPIHIWSREQPGSLYKTSNTRRHVNLYQRSDSKGINMTPSFGIHGSPVFRADLNLDMSSKLGSKGHGEITYHEHTLKTLETEIKKLYP